MWQTKFHTHIKQHEKLPFCLQQQTTVHISELHDNTELLNLIRSETLSRCNVSCYTRFLELLVTHSSVVFTG